MGRNSTTFLIDSPKRIAPVSKTEQDHLQAFDQGAGLTVYREQEERLCHKSGTSFTKVLVLVAFPCIIFGSLNPATAVLVHRSPAARGHKSFIVNAVDKLVGPRNSRFGEI